MEKAKEAANKAKEAFSKKDYAAAVKHYTEAIAFNPNDHLYFSNRSACYASLEQYEDALDDAKACVNLNPAFARGYGRKGLAEYYLRKFADAEQSYKKAIELDPANEQFKEGLARAQEQIHSSPGPAGGLGTPQEIMKKLFSDPQIREYMKDKNFVEKLQMCQTKPDHLFVLMNSDPRFERVFTAITGISMEDLKAAKGEQQMPTASPEVPKESPKEEEKPEPMKDKEEKKDVPETSTNIKDAEEYKRKGNEAYKKKDFQEALKLYDGAIVLHDKEPIYYLNKASVYLEMKDFDSCLKNCDEAIKVGEELMPKPFSKIAKAYARKGNCYAQMKKWDEALEMYDKALLEENDPAVREAKRNCENQKKREEDEKYIDPTKAEEHKEKGNKLFREGNFGAALEEYNEAIKRNPNVATLYLNRGLTYMKILDHFRALQDIDKSIELDSNYAKAYAKKGNIHFFLKEYHKAIAAYNKGLKIDPKNEECLEGKNKTKFAIYSNPPDEERAKKAMADPEIRALLQDPRIIQFFKEAKENPTAGMSAMSDPDMAEAIEKLIAAGIVGTK